MKRFWIALGLLALIFAVSTLSILHLTHAQRELDTALAAVSESINRQDAQRAAEQLDAFSKLWHKRESVMVRYMHHESLDELTGAIARLEPLARYADWAELSAELERVREVLLHVCEAEIPNLKNIF